MQQPSCPHLTPTPIALSGILSIFQNNLLPQKFHSNRKYIIAIFSKCGANSYVLHIRCFNDRHCDQKYSEIGLL